MSDLPSSSKETPSASASSNNSQPSTSEPPSQSALTDPSPEVDSKTGEEICVQVLLKLLQDPYKLCQYLELANCSEKARFPRDQSQLPEITPPELVISLKRALSNPAVLSQAVRHFQTFIDDDLYKLMTVFQTNCRCLDTILDTFLSNTKCTTQDSLAELVRFLSELLAETVPKRFRLDTMLKTTSQQLDALEAAANEKHKLPGGATVEEQEYNLNDWTDLINRSMRLSNSRIFDNSNITLADSLKTMAQEYEDRGIVNSVKVAEFPEQHRMSDSKYHRAYTVADTPDYEKIYSFLSNMTGCRTVSHKEIERADASVILNIFQEMEEVIATHFDVIGRQMPLLRDQMKESDMMPPSGFNYEDVNDIESNVCRLPIDFRNIYDLEQHRREVAAKISKTPSTSDPSTSEPQTMQPSQTGESSNASVSSRKNVSFAPPPKKQVKK